MEARIQEAFKRIRKDTFKSAYQQRSLNPIQKFVHNDMTGDKSHSQAQAKCQALSPAEEMVLV